MQEHGLSLHDALQQLATAGRQAPQVTRTIKLRGDASSRSYYRIELAEPYAGASTLIVMQLPADALKSDEGTSSERPAELPFLNLQRLMDQRGVPVPKVHAVDMRAGVLLLEDLNDETFFARLQQTPRADWSSHYAAAIDLLMDMHARMAKPDPTCIAYGRSFDATLLRWELDHFREWGLEALSGPLAPESRRALDACFDDLVSQLLALPQGFVHRDYQSRNLMWTPHVRREAAGQPSPRDPLVVIDFQDALMGPRVYDLVALLCDSYVDLDQPLQEAMVRRYAEGAGLSGADAAALQHGFWRVALQRKLKDAGRFVYIDRVRKNPDFLQWFPQSLRYVGRALTQCPEMAALSQVLHTLIPGFPDRASVPASIQPGG
jgi:aminoglycoside/choline kinase family phosphotransferase